MGRFYLLVFFSTIRMSNEVFWTTKAFESGTIDRLLIFFIFVLYNYKNEIEQVRIEGHTSSVYSSAKNESEKYAKNKELSTKRANKVVDYVSSIPNNFIIEHKDWLNDYVKPYGMASDKLIYKQGVEDESLSRRVEFVIIKKK